MTTLFRTLLDPFAGSGSTAVAAARTGRNSVSIEVEQTYVMSAAERVRAEIAQGALRGASKADLSVDLES